MADAMAPTDGTDPADHALQAAVKALAEVVSPAVDPADALAVDQLRLVISWLQFHSLRRADERRFAWAVLRQRATLAGRAACAVQGLPMHTALLAHADAAQGLLQRADAPAHEWRRASEAVDAAVSAAVDTLADGPVAQRSALADVVLAHAQDDLLLHRAWFAPLGFEARPEAVPPLQSLLKGAPPR